MNETLLRQAMARGYCTPENEKKELDSTLIDAMVKEILSIPIEPPVKPVCETVVKQLRDIIKESSMEKRLLIFAIVTTGYCLSCGVDNPKCQCDNDE